MNRQDKAVGKTPRVLAQGEPDPKARDGSVADAKSGERTESTDGRELTQTHKPWYWTDFARDRLRKLPTTKPLFTHTDRKFIGQLGLDEDSIVMRALSARVVKGGFSEGQELGQMTITSDSTDPTSSVRSPAMARRNKVKPRATEN